MNLSNNNILVTGADGFIGSHLHNKLETLGEVKGIDNYSHPSKAPNKSEYGDVRYYRDIEDYVKWADIVFHLAAQIHVDKSIKNPQETIDVNVGGTLNVLELCRKYKKKLVFASTSEVYGSSQEEFMDERHQLDAQSPYAASKVAGDRLCKSYIDTYGMDIAILRNFNTFGEYQNDGSYGGVIAIFTKQALNNEPITIYGSGEQERDYMYIDDAVNGYILASKITGVINIGTGTTVKIKELAEQIKEITKSKSEIIHLDDRAGEVQRLCAGIDKAKSLGYTPQTDFKKHLTQYINWYGRDIFKTN